MKRITFQVDDSFADELTRYCLTKGTSKKDLITNLLKTEMMLDESSKLNNNLINKENYNRLFKCEMENATSWKLRERICVNNIINQHFFKDKTLQEVHNDIQNRKIKNLQIDSALLDHIYYVNFQEKHMNTIGYLYGIMSFPYKKFEDILLILDKWSSSYWDIYIINPILMKYNATIGLFITPVKEEIISQYNSFIESLTGYKLFYTPTYKNTLPIVKNTTKYEYSEWRDSLIDKDYPEMSKKIIDFWNNNEEVKCPELENHYFEYMHNLDYINVDVLSIIIKGKNIELTDLETGWSTGKCQSIGFDIKAFKCIDVDNKMIELTDEQLKNFKKGKFELKINNLA